MKTIIPVLPLLALPLAAGELTLENGPFRVEHRFNATVLPAEAPAFSLEPEVWSAFVVETLADHGSTVTKDQPLVTFEREAYDRRLEDLERAVAARELAVARQRLEVKKLGEEQAIALESSRRTKESTAEDLEYFEKTGRPAAEAGVEQSLVQARYRLEAAEEELKQLKEMYEADDLVEATEEIILRRQQISVESAEFYLSEALRSATWRLETELPRQHESLARQARQAAIAFAKTEQNLPRELEEARISLQNAETGLAREKLELERLRRDGRLLEWKAPAAGICFHGGLDGDAWEYGELGKTLKIGGTVPTRRPLLTLVPTGAATRLGARVEPAVASSLKTGEAVALQVPDGGSPSGTIAAVDPVPGPDGKHAVRIDAEWPAGAAPVVGTAVGCIRVAHDLPDALAVPENALIATPEGGWAVELKLADGKTEIRPVKRGPANGKQVLVREGLEPGQVVVTRE